MTKSIVFSFLFLQIAIFSEREVLAQEKDETKPKISFTFDDGAPNDIGDFKLEMWNQLLLDNLKKHNLRAILFSSGYNKENEKSKYVLSSWNDAGHLIGNHTYSHANFNSKMVSLKSFESELIQIDTIMNKYSNYYRYFRFPYLKEGNTALKENPKADISGFRDYYKNHLLNRSPFYDSLAFQLTNRRIKHVICTNVVAHALDN